MAEDDGFLARWSRRKASHRQGEPVPEPALEAAEPPLPTPADASEAPPHAIAAVGAEPVPITDAPAVDDAAQAPAKPAPPTLADVAQLTRESDFTRFVTPDVELEVKNAALKKLFADPQFNVMDGLDVYIDDYSRPDPLPKTLVKQMAQAAFMGLIDTPAGAPVASARPDAPEPAEPAIDPPPAAGAPALDNPPCDENTDLRLQSHDAAGRDGAAEGAAGEPGPVEP